MYAQQWACATAQALAHGVLALDTSSYECRVLAWAPDRSVSCHMMRVVERFTCHLRVLLVVENLKRGLSSLLRFLLINLRALFGSASNLGGSSWIIFKRLRIVMGCC